MNEQMYDAYALVMVHLEAGHALRASNEISRLEEVGFVMAVAGDADLAILVKLINIAHLGELIVERIEGVKGVEKTCTSVGLSPFIAQNWLLKNVEPHHAYAIVHVEAGPGSTLHVKKEISKLEEVGLAIAVSGDADVIALVKAHNVDHLGELVVGRIEDIKGVEQTRTYVGLSPFSPQNWLLST